MNVLAKYGWLADSFECVRPEQNGAAVRCACPMRHSNPDDKLWFTLGDNGNLCFRCWSGHCDKLEILRAVGRTWKDCFPPDVEWATVKREVVARYPYTDENGVILFRKCRVEPGYGGADKTFYQERRVGNNQWDRHLGDVRRVLYRLPRLLKADPTELVFLCAGEKDVESLERIGLLATTNVGGEREEWAPEYSEPLRGREVVVIEDADRTGWRHANEVCGALMEVAASVRRVRMPKPYKDSTAYLNALRVAGVTDTDELREIFWGAVCERPKWEREPEPDLAPVRGHSAD